MLLTSGALVIAPVLRSLLDSSADEVSTERFLQRLALDRSATTDSATTTTVPRPGGAAGPHAAATAAPSPNATDALDPLAALWASQPVAAQAPPSVPAARPAPPPGPAPPRIKGGRGRTQSGKASWYEIQDGTCAHVRLPKGTLVRVVNVANAKEVTCRVADRGPFLSGRIIDLDLQSFQKIASSSQGVVDVRISW